MKTNCAKPGNFRRHLGLLVSAGALCLLGLTALGATTPKSPVGTWGCVMSGQREGLASMTFLADGTFSAFEILVPKPSSTPKPDNDNRGSTDTGRVPVIGMTNTTTVHTNINLFGWQDPVGQWGYDIKGRVIGFFYEYSDTNFIPTTTNKLSFVGTVVPGKRLTLQVSTANGTIIYRGVPDQPLADLSGSWYGIERQPWNGSESQSWLWNTEFFTLTNLSPVANFYQLEGTGPGYTLSGVVMVVPQKKIAMVTGSIPVSNIETNSSVTIRSVVGSANLKRLSGSLHGLKDAGAGTTQRLSYSMQHQ